MGIKEILEAKRLKALAETGSVAMTNETSVVSKVEAQPESKPVPVEAPAVGVNTSVEAEQMYKPDEPEHILPQDHVDVHVEDKPVYPTHDSNGKPLSGFAAIQMRKKIDAEWAARKPVATKVVEAEQLAPAAAPSIPEQKANVVSIAKTVVTPKIEVNSSSNEEDEGTPEAQQAYSDIKVRLDSLTSLADDNLKTAMQELKRALMQNPNAVALMLPSDIGQMVIALRKMTGVELAKVEEKKTGKVKKTKEVALTAEQMEEAWKEI